MSVVTSGKHVEACDKGVASWWHACGEQVASKWQASGRFQLFLQYCLSSIYCQKRMGECCQEWQVRGKPVARVWQAGGMLVASLWQASGKRVASDRQASGT